MPIKDHGSFVNSLYKKEWDVYTHDGKTKFADGTFFSDDGEWFAVYDGATNYMGRVNKTTGEIQFNGTPDVYKETFLVEAKRSIRH